MVLAYPRSDPRRKELTAELEVVPRIERPLWVAEQLEVALSEGVGHRVSAAIRRRQTRKRRRLLVYGAAAMFGTALLGGDLDPAVLREDRRSALLTALPPVHAARLAMQLDAWDGMPLSRRRRHLRMHARMLRRQLVRVKLNRWRGCLRVHAGTIRRRLARRLRR